MSNRIRKTVHSFGHHSRSMSRNWRDRVEGYQDGQGSSAQDHWGKSWGCIIWWRRRQLNSSIWLHDEELQRHQSQTPLSYNRRYKRGHWQQGECSAWTLGSKMSTKRVVQPRTSLPGEVGENSSLEVSKPQPGKTILTCSSAGHSLGDTQGPSK